VADNTEAATPAVPATATPAATPAEAAKSTVAAVDPAAPKPNGAVSLAVLPWANVYVDGVQRGVSPPLKKLMLPEGSHQIKIQNPNFPEYVVRVTVDAHKAITVSRDFSSAQP
jgi:non-specific serine/threonine protein kinase